MFVLLLWMVLFFGGGMMPGLTGVMISSVNNDVKPLATSLASVFTNLLGYLPAPIIYGFICDFTGGRTSPYGMLTIIYFCFISEFFIILTALTKNKLVYLMSIWRKICCCITGQDITVGDNTRLLPKTDKENTAIEKLESPYIIFIYGVGPPDLHLKRIPESFSKLGILKIACGLDHILMLTDVNYVLAAGNNRYGQCARVPVKKDDVPDQNLNIKLSAFNVPGFKVNYI